MKKILFLLIATIITHVAYSQTKTMTCPTCMGKGVFVCPSCLGKGLIYDSYFGYSACYNCGGAGSFKCGLCHGKGKVVLPDYNPNINYNNTNCELLVFAVYAAGVMLLEIVKHAEVPERYMITVR